MENTPEIYETDTNRGHIALGLVLIGVIEFAFGLFLGWLIWA